MEEQLRLLEKKVSNYTTTPSSSILKTSSSYLSGINLKVVAVYGIVPVLTIIVLTFTKPSFICKEQEDEESLEKNISLQKLFLSTVVLSVILDGLVFMYLRKKGIKL